MTFETPPIERVQARPLGLALVVVGLAAVTGILVWQPWSTGASRPSNDVASAPSSVPSPGAAALGPVATPVATPYEHPRGLTMLRSAPAIMIPTLDLFRPRWSVVGVTEQAGGGVDVRQLPMVATSGALEGRGGAELCALAVVGSASVALLPSDTLQLLGIAAPASEIGAPTELTRIEPPLLSAYEVAVPPPVEATESPGQASAAASGDPAPDQPGVRLFVRSDLLHWAAGLYRFHTEAPDGTPRFLYACLLRSDD